MKEKGLLYVEELGVSVFNGEVDKFNRWFNKENVSLGGVTPLNMMNVEGGMKKVVGALNRIEYGNMA